MVIEIVIMHVRKFELWKPPSKRNRRLWMLKGIIPLSTKIKHIDEFACYIQSEFGEGRFSILGNARRHKGFYRIFLGTIKKNKAVGSGKIHYYLAKNKEKALNHK